MHSLAAGDKCVRYRYDPIVRCFSSNDHDESSDDTEAHCSGIVIDLRGDARHLAGAGVELRVTHSSSSGRRFYCFGATLSPSDGSCTLDVTKVNLSASPTR